jgi:hypothetical protein
MAATAPQMLGMMNFNRDRSDVSMRSPKFLNIERR